MRFLRWFLAAASVGLFNLSTGWAADVVGAPKRWEMGMQTSYSPIKDRIIDLHNLVLIIITLITIFVAALLVVVMVKFSARKNPNPSQNTHNTMLEVAWTAIPVLILVVIAIPSFRLIYYQDRTADPDLTIKVTGHQWYWEYNYPDNGNVTFDSRYIADEDLKPGQLRLLDVDNQMVIPVNKRVRILTASSDVIHSFFIPAFGVQRYAIPGRTIETWLTANQTGTFYGECNQICGTAHSRMPIAVKALSQADFDAWVKTQKAAMLANQPKLALN
jgi:cytochrome c oxidase subunit 2